MNQLVLGIVIMQLRVATQLLLSEELMPLTSNRPVNLELLNDTPF